MVKAVIFLVSVLLLSACTQSGPQKPADVARSYMEAFVFQDFERAKAYVVDEYKPVYDELAKAMKSNEAKNAGIYWEPPEGFNFDSYFKVVKEDIQGDAAIVEFSLGQSVEEQPMTWGVKLNKQGGLWKILAGPAIVYPPMYTTPRALPPDEDRALTPDKNSGRPAPSFESISKGEYSGYGERKDLVVKDAAEWTSLWDKVHSIRIPKPDLPQIDFSEEMVIAVFGGEYSTGGHYIEVTKVTENETSLEVFVKETHPAPSDLVTQALTQPYHVVKTGWVDKEVIFTRSS